MFQSLGLLVISNLFMTFAWYGHLKSNQHSKLWIVILVSWAIAFFEYCFQVPANRIGINYLSLGQLKVMQEVITMTVFGLFSIFYMKIPLTKNFFFASICLVLAAFFIFKEQGQGI
jgi:uncharacterized protein (DUF486 family)